MKRKHKKYYSISRTTLINSRRNVPAVSASGRIKSYGGAGDLLQTGLDMVNLYAATRNLRAIGKELNAHMAELEIGEKRTVIITYGGGKAETVVQAPNHGQIFGPAKNSITYKLEGREPKNQQEFQSWIDAKMQKDFSRGKIEPLPADSNLDRSYRQDRARWERASFDFGEALDNAPKGDFNTSGDKDTMWA